MSIAAVPSHDCPICPRLQAFREEWRGKKPDWFNSPVPAFGPVAARLAVVGLAPGLQGANRTGRPFTGDYAGDLLYETLAAFGFSKGEFGARIDDGLMLVDCRIVNAVRCVPPQNKPTGNEINNCRPFLAGALKEMPDLSAIVALGRIAHESVLRAFGCRLSEFRFAHGGEHALGAVRLFDSYHCSRYNTNTGRLTPAMFQSVFAQVRAYLDGRSAV
jgi:uracil-DNA glycosylase